MEVAKKQSVKYWSQFAVQMLLGLMFLVSSILKACDIESFELYVFSLNILNFDLCSFAARLLIIFEAFVGTALIINVFKKTALILSALSLVGFSIFLLWRIILGDTESCHCMGELVDLNPVASLVKNLVLGLMLWFIWKSPNFLKDLAGRKLRLAADVALGVVMIAVTSVSFAVIPPDFFYRMGSSPDDFVNDQFLPVAEALDLVEGKHILCFYSTECPHCRSCASKMASIISRHDIPTDSVKVIFMQLEAEPADQDAAVDRFFRDFGNGLQLPYSSIHPYTFIPLTKGFMPIVILYEDGAVVKEYDYLTIDEYEIAEFL